MSQTTQGAAAPLFDRFTASKLNPFIGANQQETLESCTLAVSDLGYIVSAADTTGCSFDTSNLFRMFEVITRALRYEIEATNQGEKA